MAVVQEQRKSFTLDFVVGPAQDRAVWSRRVNPGRESECIVEAEVPDIACIDVPFAVKIRGLSLRAGDVGWLAIFPLGLSDEGDGPLGRTVLHEVEVLFRARRIGRDPAIEVAVETQVNSDSARWSPIELGS